MTCRASIWLDCCPVIPLTFSAAFSKLQIFINILKYFRIGTFPVGKGGLDQALGGFSLSYKGRRILGGQSCPDPHRFFPETIGRKTPMRETENFIPANAITEQQGSAGRRNFLTVQIVTFFLKKDLTNFFIKYIVCAI